MAIEIANAISAYNNAVQRIGEGAAGDSGGGSGTGAVGGSEFSAMLQRFAENAVEAGKEGERQSAAAAAGQADINDVVTAVAEAELTLNAVVAVRDKVIEAYQSIIRMPI